MSHEQSIAEHKAVKWIICEQALKAAVESTLYAA